LFPRHRLLSCPQPALRGKKPTKHKHNTTMSHKKLSRKIFHAGLSLFCAFALCLQAASQPASLIESEPELGALLDKLEPLQVESVPEFGTFWLLTKAEPPWPFCHLWQLSSVCQSILLTTARLSWTTGVSTMLPWPSSIRCLRQPSLSLA